MEDLKFKDVAGHYIGSKVLRPDGRTILTIYGVVGSLIAHIEENHDEYTYSGITGCKPILFPLSAMTDEQCWNWNEQFRFFSIDASEEYIRKRLHAIRQEVTHNRGTSPEKVLWLLRNHFNVFNLPESEYIDASKLPVNPYSKPNH